MLGYKPLPRDVFTPTGFLVLHNHPDDYKYFEGVYAELSFSDPKRLMVYTRTNIWRSRSDTDLHNHTVRQLKNRFGGSFESDNGKNRYLTNDDPYIEGAEAGCHQTYSRFASNIKTLTLALETFQTAKTGIDWAKATGVPPLDAINPLVLLSNIAVPFLVSTIEDFFRSAYVALLKYSHNRESIVKDSRISGDDLILISNGQTTIEEALARTRSFQNMKRIIQSFREIDRRIDIGAVLRKPYRTNASIYDTFERVISHRHMMIHRAEIITNYTPTKLLHDIDPVCQGIRRFYLSLVDLYGWRCDHPEIDPAIWLR